VPGNRVAAVAIEAQPGGGERLAEFLVIVGIQCLTSRDQVGVRKWIVLAIEAEQSRHVDNPLVHLSPLRLPRHLFQEVFEEAAGAAQPTGQQIYPRATAESLAGNHAAKRSTSEVVGDS
jgi:hypothetical protein